MEILSSILARNVAMVPDRTFIVSEHQSLTYRQFFERTGQLANVLAARGVRKGDVVGLYLPSTPMMAIGFWACQRLGAVPAPISAMFRHAELRKVIERAGIEVVISDASSSHDSQRERNTTHFY